MRRWRPRLATLAVLSFTGAATLGFFIAHAAASRYLQERLSTLLQPAEIRAVLEDFDRTFAVFAALGILVGAVLAGYVGVLVSRRVLRVRADALRRARGGRDPFSRPAIAELHRLAGTIERMATEMEARADSLDRERDELSLLVQSVSEGILLVGPDQRVMHANPAARLLLGLPDDCRGQPLAALVRHGELRQIVESAAEGESAAAEVDLDDRLLLVVPRPVPAAGGDEEGISVVVVLIDLTQIRRLEGVRRDFVANVSHELKTPLTSIQGYVETLRTEDLGTELRNQFLEVIQKNAHRLQSIVDDLLDLSRIESGGWTPEIEDFDPATIIADTWDGLARRGRERGISYIREPGVSQVRADPSALRHILVNLFDNAIRHTDEGGTISVAVRPAANGDRSMVRIEVTDDGTGIPIEDLPRIFERFYRADPARSRAEGGTGLGLSIVKHLAESMDGDVAAESELGKGTTIRISLPAAPQQP